MRQRNLKLDFLKGICMLMVLITHMKFSSRERLLGLFPFWIDMAIPVFMSITGYLYSASYEKHDITTLDQMYSKENIRRRFIQYTVPYVIFFLIEITLMTILEPQNLSWGGVLQSLVTGGWGPGSYYYPALIQLIIFFPLFHKMVNEYKHGLIYSFVASFACECAKGFLGITKFTYRLMLFRHVPFVTLGIYMYVHRKENFKNRYWFFMIIGIVYSILTNYTPYEPPVFYWWTTTSIISGLMIVPLMKYITIEKNIAIPRMFHWVAYIGKNSYNVFLGQMIFYYFFAERFVYPYIGNKVEGLAISIVCCLVISALLHPVNNTAVAMITNISERMSRQ